MRDECPLSEVRAPSQHPPSRTSESHGLLTNLLILVPLYRSEVPDRIRRSWSRDFRSAVLAIVRNVISKVGDLLLGDRTHHVRHGAVVTVPRVVLVFGKRLGEVILALVGKPRHVFLAGKIRIVTKVAAVGLR